MSSNKIVKEGQWLQNNAVFQMLSANLFRNCCQTSLLRLVFANNGKMSSLNLFETKATQFSSPAFIFLTL